MKRPSVFNWVVAAGFFCLAAGCAEPVRQDSESAAAVEVNAADCDASSAYAKRLGEVSGLANSVVTTPALIVAWQKVMNGPAGPSAVSDWVEQPATEPVSLCLFSGTFQILHSPPGVEVPAGSYVLVSDKGDGMPQVEYMVRKLPVAPLPEPLR